jgi:hypothetical protein
MKPFALKHLLPTEDDECQNLIQWARYTRHNGFCVADYLVMIPNRVKLTGDARERAMIMASWKRTGFKTGASDYILAIPTPRYPGMWLEVKRTELSVTSEDQVEFQDRMRKVGYFCVISKGWEEAKRAIEGYLNMDIKP